jgi:hypothetical protein
MVLTHGDSNSRNKTGETRSARERLNLLHDEGMSWRQIAALPEFEGIPAGTLCSIAKGDFEPRANEVRRRLGLTEIVQQEVLRDERGRFMRLKALASEPQKRYDKRAASRAQESTETANAP